MKNLIYGTLFLTLVGIGILSCKKDEPEPLNRSTETLSISDNLQVSSNDEFLVFENSDIYESIISKTDSSFISSFLEKVRKLNYVSHFESISSQKSDNNYIDNEYLSSILNKDMVVQIGDYLYRVNKANEKVYVLASEYLDQYEDLVSENTKNKNILEYSTGDDVIDMVEGGVKSNEKAYFCGEGGIGGQESISNVVNIGNSGYTFHCYNDFNRYGIYFSLAIWVRSTAPNDSFRFYIQAENLWYHVKCSYTTGPYSFPWYSQNAYNSTQKYQSYSGSRNLNGVHVKSRGRCEIPNAPSGGNPYTVVFTDWNTINMNSPY
jgi:hypothetical protein